MAAMTSMSMSNSNRMPFVGHLGNIALKIVGVVSDVLDPAIWEIDRVMSFSSSSSIALLLLIKSSPCVAVSNSIVVVVGNNLVVSISMTSMSDHMASMSNCMSSMPKAMTSMTS